MKKASLVLAIVLLLIAAALLQWGLDGTSAGIESEQDDIFPSAASMFEFLGGARQYLSYTFYIKTDKLYHTYTSETTDQAELVPYLIVVTLLNPHYVSAYYVGSGLMDELGRTEEAIDFNQQGLDANPEAGDLYYNLGSLYLEQSRYQEAKEVFEKALEYDMEIASRNTLLSALAASYGGLGEMESRRRILMEKAIYNQMRLKLGELDYEQQKLLVQVINNTIDQATEDTSREMDEAGSR